MARVNVDSDLWLNGRRYQSALTSVAVSRNVELRDATTFASGGYRANKPGLLTYAVAVAGFWDADMDAVIRGLVGQGGVQFMVLGPAVGPRGAWSGAAVGGAATLFGAPVGDLLGYRVELAADDAPDLRRSTWLRTRVDSPHGAEQLVDIAGPEAYSFVRIQATRAAADRNFTVKVESRETAGDPWGVHGAAVEIFAGASLVGTAEVPVDIEAGHLARMSVEAAAGVGSDVISYAAVAAR